MTKHLLVALLAWGCLVVSSRNARAVLPAFSENFESYSGNTAFPTSSFLNGNGGKVLTEANGNKYFSVDAQDHDLWTLQAPGYDNFVLTFRQNQTAYQDWNHVFALYWTTAQGVSSNTWVQLIRTPTGIGFGSVTTATGATPITVPGSTLSTDWLWFRLTRTGTTLKVEGSLTNSFTNAPYDTLTLPGGNYISLLGWKYQPTVNVDDITLAAVPEPASLGFLALGGLLALRRRRR